MKHLRAPIAVTTLIASCFVTAQAQTVTVPAGTTVSVELMENVHSSFNTQGEVIYLQVADPVIIAGNTVLPEGARVEAEVGSVEGAGMLGKSGGVTFHPVRIAAADGQWLPLDPTNFGDEGEGAGAGMIVAIGVFAKGRPGFVPLGTTYRVTIRRDTEVASDVVAPARAMSEGDLLLTGSVAPIPEIRTKKTKPDDPITIELSIPSDLASLVTTGATDVKIVSFNDYAPERAVESQSVELDRRSNALEATFDWWSIVRHVKPGSNTLVAQIELTDGRRAQANLTVATTWEID